MKELLKGQLRNYIIDNNPQLWMELQEEQTEDAYLKDAISELDPLMEKLLAEEHPPYIISEVCMDELTKSLRPSKYNYVRVIAEEKFPVHYAALERAGILVMELSNIVAICVPIFEVFNFSEEIEDEGYLRESIARAIKAYFDV